jgi:hypothetical protein
MTYTFSPLATIPASHDGFAIACFLTVFILAIIWMNEGIVSVIMSLIPTALILLTIYCISYVWTDQTPKTFANQQVIGELVGFQPEGYREKSGKTMVDKHYMYVVYKVNGEQIILNATTGVTYPERVTLYKN